MFVRTEACTNPPFTHPDGVHSHDLPTPGMCFGQALLALEAGEVVSRAGWNGKGMWLKLQVPDAGSKMTLPYIFMRTAQGDFVPWLASQTDVLAKDWTMAA